MFQTTLALVETAQGTVRHVVVLLWIILLDCIGDCFIAHSSVPFD
jgi:hypothetical protein